MKPSKILYLNCKQLCRTKGISIADLEDSLGTSRGYLSRGRIGLDMAAMVAKKLDTNLNRITSFGGGDINYCPSCGSDNISFEADDENLITCVCLDCDFRLALD